MKADGAKETKLFEEYLDFISSPEESENYLREKGYDPDALVNEGIMKAKQVMMKLASQKTAQQYQEVKASLFEKARKEVEKLLSEASFSLENFFRQENLNLSFRNFEKMSPTEVREFMEHHFLLKYENELRGESK